MLETCGSRPSHSRNATGTSCEGGVSSGMHEATAYGTQVGHGNRRHMRHAASPRAQSEWPGVGSEIGMTTVLGTADNHRS